MKLIITESQLRTIVSEHYDPDKLYNREAIVNALKKAPAYMKKYSKTLPHVDCSNGTKGCTKIPQVVYQYLFGNF
jgi:hypothetical protein